jgi:twinkle protein
MAVNVIHMHGRGQRPAPTVQREDLAATIQDGGERLFSKAHKTGFVLPWQNTHGTIWLRPAEVTIWAGYPGHGKSTLVNHMGMYLLAQGAEVFHVSLEMDRPLLGQQLLRQLAGSDNPDPRWIEAAREWLKGRSWQVAYGNGEPARVADVLGEIEGFLMGDTERHVILDNLSWLDLPERDGAAEAVRDLMVAIKALAERHRGHVHLVCHLRKGENDRKRPSMMDVVGSRYYTLMAHNVFLIRRNRDKDDFRAMPPDELAELEGRRAERAREALQEPDAFLSVEKNRVGGSLRQFGLWFDPASQQFMSNDRGHRTQFGISAMDVR